LTWEGKESAALAEEQENARAPGRAQRWGQWGDVVKMSVAGAVVVALRRGRFSRCIVARRIFVIVLPRFPSRFVVRVLSTKSQKAKKRGAYPDYAYTNILGTT
jgi:hypothetical protein